MPSWVLSWVLSTIKKKSFSRGRKRHINIWHINNFSVTPVTDPPGRVPESSRPGTRTKMFMFLGFRTQHINFWPPGHRSGDPPPTRSGDAPPTRAITGQICLCLCAFSVPDSRSKFSISMEIFNRARKFQSPGEIQKGTGGRGRDSRKVSYDALWRFMTLHDILWRFMTFDVKWGKRRRLS